LNVESLVFKLKIANRENKELLFHVPASLISLASVQILKRGLGQRPAIDRARRFS
jgi:hypothetical protein